MVHLTRRLLVRVPEYWKRYTERCMNLRSRPARQVYLRGWVGEDKRHDWIHIAEPVYTDMAQVMNLQKGKRKWFVEKELLEPIKEWTVVVGDRVEVLVGRDKGKQGIVSRIVHERNWVFVEGLNIQYKNTVGDVLRVDIPLEVEEMPLDVTTEVALVDPATEKPAKKVEWRYTDKGERVRVVIPSEIMLPLPTTSELQADGVQPDIYIEDPMKDTSEKQLSEPTYKANLKTFEEDIMDSLGIVETRKRGKTYWY